MGGKNKCDADDVVEKLRSKLTSPTILNAVGFMQRGTQNGDEAYLYVASADALKDAHAILHGVPFDVALEESKKISDAK